jgi:hypothetical protein
MAIAVRTRPSLASHRPAKPVRPASGEPAITGAGTSRRAWKVPAAGSKVMSAPSKPSHCRVTGNHALYTDSLALNRSRSQQVPGAAAASSRSRARSPGSETWSSTPSGRISSGSASTPMVSTSLVLATAAAR